MKKIICPTLFALFGIFFCANVVIAGTTLLNEGIKFPDGTVQTTSASGATGQWSASDTNIYYSAGNVGIGTSSPAAKLHIKGNDFPHTFIYLDTNEANQDAGIRFYENSSMKGHLFHDASEGLLRLETNQAQIVLRSSDGNVGIGTNDPGEKLEVAGNIEVTGSGNGVVFPDGTVQRSASAPIWGGILPDDERFTIVLNGNGVLDNETGLVWERTPSPDQYEWGEACAECYKKRHDDRGGWRLPTVDELASLVKFEGIPTTPKLPLGHPFFNYVKADFYYWTSTQDATDSTMVWGVAFVYINTVESLTKNNHCYVWCVRGK